MTRHGEPEAVLHAEKRLYNTSRMVMTEAAIDGGLTRDLYAALGRSWTTARGPCACITNRLSAGYGPGTADGAGRAAVPADPRYRRRKPLPEAG